MDMRQLRKRLNLRTIDVASRLGIADSTVRNWEQGKTVPTLPIAKIPELLKLYGCSLEEFIAAIEETSSKTTAA